MSSTSDIKTLVLIDERGAFTDHVVQVASAREGVMMSFAPDDAVSCITEARDAGEPFDIVVLARSAMPYPLTVQVTLIALTSAPDTMVLLRTDDEAPWDTLVGQLPESERVMAVPATEGEFAIRQTMTSLEALMGRRVPGAPAPTEPEQMVRHRRHLEVVGQLAAGVAHEMNTPLQFVNDSVFFVKDGWSLLTALISRYREALTILEAEGRHREFVEMLRAIEAESDLDYFVENVDDAFGRIDQGVGRMVEIVRALRESAPGAREGKAMADVNKAVRNALTMTRGTWRYTAQVETDLQTVPGVMCHFGELSGAFVNLIVNAVHAIEERWDKRGGGQIRISSEHRGDVIAVVVEDNGCGVPPELQPRIFDPFFSSKPVGRGTGQGLSIAQTTVEERHGGKIFFTSRAGHGTRFVIELPVTQSDSRTPTTVAP